LLVLGGLAGLYISVGGHLFLVALSAGLGKVVGGAVFSVGLALAAGIAAAKMALPFGQAFLRGVFANVLVILAVIMAIMAIMAKEIVSKVMVIILPIMTFVAVGFEHSIANMFLIPVGLLAEGAPVSAFGSMWSNLIPVTLGNIVGGLFILLIHPNRIKQVQHLLSRRRQR